MRQIWEVRRRIGVTGSLLGAFDRPSNMTEAEFIRRTARYLELANRLDLSTREFKFRRNNVAGTNNKARSAGLVLHGRGLIPTIPFVSPTSADSVFPMPKSHRQTNCANEQ
jgi:hypothetical protein